MVEELRHTGQWFNVYRDIGYGISSVTVFGETIARAHTEAGALKGAVITLTKVLKEMNEKLAKDHAE